MEIVLPALVHDAHVAALLRVGIRDDAVDLVQFKRRRVLWVRDTNGELHSRTLGPRLVRRHTGIVSDPLRFVTDSVIMRP